MGRLYIKSFGYLLLLENLNLVMLILPSFVCVHVYFLKNNLLEYSWFIMLYW